jgi:hypothetical protein
MLDEAPDFFVDNDDLSAPPHEPEHKVKSEIWDYILQGNRAGKTKSFKFYPRKNKMKPIFFIACIFV